MRASTFHKINQVIHIIILLKGDTPTKWSLCPNNNHCVLTSSLFIVKYLTQCHQQDNMHSTTICKGVLFLLFIQFASYNNSQMYNSNHLHFVNHQNQPLITHYFNHQIHSKVVFQNCNEVIILSLQLGMSFKMHDIH